MDKISSKTVYFFGAGASATSEFNLPTMREFFKGFPAKEYINLSRFIVSYFFPPISFPSVFNSIIFENMLNLQDKETLELIEDEIKKEVENITITELNKGLNEEIEKIESNIKQSKLNLEEVMSYLELSISKFGRFGEYTPDFLHQAKRELLDYVKNRVFHRRNPINVPLPSEKYKALLRNLNPLDSIITLNYDLIIEDSLEKLWNEMDKKEREKFVNGKDSQSHPLIEKLNQVLINQPLWWDRPEWLFYTPEEIGTGVFLKLHGSINWAYCVNSSCRHHFSIFPVEYKELISQLITLPACRVCGQPVEMVIVPPTMYKVFEKFPKLGFIWSLARKELFRANKIVIIGVSFAPSDYYLRWLFKSALALLRLRPEIPTIEVVNTDEDACGTVEEITGRKPEFKGDLDKYLQSIGK